MDLHGIMWVVFWIVVSAALFIDLVILNKHHGNVGFKDAVIMVCTWVSLALAFGVAVLFTLGDQKALEFITGYVVEYSLSIDNMFVFLMIFSYFNIPRANQPKVLLYGILGAVVLRLLFVIVGVQLITSFVWMIYLFGAILILTAIRMLIKKGDDVNPEKNIAYKILKKILPFKPDVSCSNFFIKENGLLYATPMLAAVCVIEMSDIVFAVDSIPAVLSISTDTFIVYSSNIFAIVGLRSLFFLLSNLASKFKYLQYGVAVILLFVGLKMIASHFIHVPILLSLGVIIIILMISILASVISNRKSA